MNINNEPNTIYLAKYSKMHRSSVHRHTLKRTLKFDCLIKNVNIVFCRWSVYTNSNCARQACYNSCLRRAGLLWSFNLTSKPIITACAPTPLKWQHAYDYTAESKCKKWAVYIRSFHFLIRSNLPGITLNYLTWVILSYV